MSTELELSAKTFGLEVEQVKEITNGLETIKSERIALIDTYEDVIGLEITEDNLKTFKDLRLLIRDNRTKGLKNWHKTNKAYFLAGGNFVQAIYNKEVLINESMEEKLLGAEKHFENLEKERLENLQFERLNKINPYVEDGYLVDYSIMEEEFFNDYFDLKKAKFDKAEKERIEEAEKLRVEAEKEKERQAEIEAENAKLKTEAEAKQKQSDLEAKQRANKEALRLGIEKKAKEKQDAILKEAKDKADKLEAELKAKQEAELKAKKLEVKKLEDEKKKQLKLDKAPLKEQLTIWVNNFEIPLPKEANETTLNIAKKFNAFKEWAKLEIATL
jgi:colicin import membrane protein